MEKYRAIGAVFIIGELQDVRRISRSGTITRCSGRAERESSGGVLRDAACVERGSAGFIRRLQKMFVTHDKIKTVVQN